MAKRNSARNCAALAGVIAILVLPSPARAFDWGHAAAVGFDIAVVRPLGVVETTVGLVLAVPVVLIGAPGGPDAWREVWETFVSEPAKNVYKRPLGEF